MPRGIPEAKVPKGVWVGVNDLGLSQHDDLAKLLWDRVREFDRHPLYPKKKYYDLKDQDLLDSMILRFVRAYGYQIFTDDYAKMHPGLPVYDPRANETEYGSRLLALRSSLTNGKLLKKFHLMGVLLKYRCKNLDKNREPDHSDDEKFLAQPTKRRRTGLSDSFPSPNNSYSTGIDRYWTNDSSDSEELYTPELGTPTSIPIIQKSGLEGAKSPGVGSHKPDPIPTQAFDLVSAQKSGPESTKSPSVGPHKPSTIPTQASDRVSPQLPRFDLQSYPPLKQGETENENLVGFRPQFAFVTSNGRCLWAHDQHENFQISEMFGDAAKAWNLDPAEIAELYIRCVNVAKADKASPDPCILFKGDPSRELEDKLSSFVNMCYEAMVTVQDRLLFDIKRLHRVTEWHPSKTFIK